ncbi:MAG TPA: GAF domain-containing sensor histidine kinase [Anaerolineae bacterium]|nr:GAF domain-containing sensor histidine kinase [Anaerolineae bacterium]
MPHTTDLETRLARFRRVLDLSRILNSTLDLVTLLTLIIEAAREITRTEAASILLTDPKTGDLYFEAATGTKSEEVKRVVVPPNSLAGWVAREGKPQIIDDVSSDPRFSPLSDQQSGFKTRALIALPLQVKGRTIGVLESVNRVDDTPFNDEDVDVLSALAAHAAVAIENARLFQQSDLISEMVHELRTPLTSIVAYGELLMRDDLKREQQRAFVETMLQESTRLAAMINDFLDLARLQSGRARLAHVPVDIGGLLRDCVSVMKPQADKKNIQVELDAPAGLPVVEGDAGRLKQVLMNLLSNAIKYTAPGGRVNARAGQRNDSVQVAIEDTGRGIPEQDLPHIFDKFYRVADSEGWATGTGLGLSIAKEIVEVHGGQIDVVSQVGVGTTVTLVIPRSYRA